MNYHAARRRGRTLAAALIDRLPADPDARERALSAVQAEVNAEYRAATDELHRRQIGDRPCPSGRRCTVHGPAATRSRRAGTGGQA